MSVARPDPLTPFVGPRRRAVDEAVSRLFREVGRVRWAAGTRGDGPWRLAVRVEPGRGPAVDAELDAADVARPASVVVGGLRLTVKRPPGGAGGDEFRRAVTEVVGAFRRGAHGASPGLVASVEAWRPWAGVEDAHLRRIAVSTEGLVGLLRLGFRCNQDCGFCWQGRDWPDPPPELYPVWIDEMAAAGVGRITISGGEPTLVPELPAFVARARAHGVRVSLQTNAVRLRRRDYVDELVAAGVDGLLVSLHAADPETSDAMTRAPRTWRPTVDGVRNALDAGLMVGINAVVDRRNAGALEAHARFVVGELVAGRANPVRVVNYSHPSPAFDRDGWEALLPPLDEVAPSLVAAVRALKAAGVAVHAAGSCGFPPCTWQGADDVVPWIGRDQSDEHDLAARTYAPACAACAVRGHCPGLRPEYLARWGDRGVTPFATPPASLGSD